MLFTSTIIDHKDISSVKWSGSYDGSWVDNLKHGKGVFAYENGDKYSGDWKNGKKEGFGTYSYAVFY